MANTRNRFSVKIRGDQENPGVAFQSTSKNVPESTRFPFTEPRGQQKKSYELLCSNYLRKPFGGTGAAASNQTEILPFKNWSLWSVWNEELSQNIEVYTEEEFVKLVNGTFEREPIFEKNKWEDLELDGFIVVRVEKVHCHSYTKRIFLTCQRVCFEETKDEVDAEEIMMAKKKGKVIELQAFTGLGEILAAVVEQLDVLIISGGYLQNEGPQKVPIFTLNCDCENHTQILRLPGYQFDEMNLVELIQPQKGEQRYKFSFGARIGKTVKEVVQHRNYNYEKFGKDAMSSMAYDDGRWDFPVPVVKDTVKSIYDSLVQWDCSMFRERKVDSKPPRQRRMKPEVELNKTFTITSPPPTPKSRSIQLMKRVSNCVEFILFLILSLFLIVIIVFVVCNMEHVLGECSD